MQLFTRPTAAFAGEAQADIQASLDQLEQALKHTLVVLAPDRAAGRGPALGKRQASQIIDEALQKNTQAHIEALGRAGLSESVVALLQSWVETTVDARVLQRELELKQPRVADDHVSMHAPASPVEDPTSPLSATALGRALGGLSDETVRQRERSGELFSILRPGRKRGREYPAFQAWPGMAGEPLARILAALRPVSSTEAYGFFTSPTELLGGLTPIEATVGQLTSARQLDAETIKLLQADPQKRLAIVVKAAEAFSALAAA